MADIKLMDLPECTSTKSDDYLLLDQDGTTKKVSYDTLVETIRHEIRNLTADDVGAAIINDIPTKATSSEAQAGVDDSKFIVSKTLGETLLNSHFSAKRDDEGNIIKTPFTNAVDTSTLTAYGDRILNSVNVINCVYEETRHNVTLDYSIDKIYITVGGSGGGSGYHNTCTVVFYYYDNISNKRYTLATSSNTVKSTHTINLSSTKNISGYLGMEVTMTNGNSSPNGLPYYSNSLSGVVMSVADKGVHL